MGKAKVEFAPDGIHWQTIKKGKLGKLLDYFNFSPDIQTQLWLNPFAKFRLVGDEKIIGVLPREK